MYCKVLQATKQAMKGNVGSRFRFGMHLMHPHLRFSCPFLHQLSAELMESNQLCNSCRDRLSFCFVKHGQSFQSHYVLCIYVWVQEIMFFCHKPCVSRITGGTAGERCFGVLEHYPNRPKVRCCSIWHWLNEELQLCLR